MDITTKIGCPMACDYCPQDKLIKAYTKRSNILLMSFDVFKKCLDKIPLNVDIHFSGLCEPWLNPECTKMLLYAHRRGHTIKAGSTLVGMSSSDIDLLETVPIKTFVVHLPSNQGYEKIKIDENYLNLLNRISKSNIKVYYHIHGEGVHPKIKPLIKNNITREEIHTRAGNIKIKNRPAPPRKKGVIGCRRKGRYNILLPNGDVLLCCMDFGMQHLLGNLISSDYNSLFRGKEFLKIKKGLNDESIDILCRYCERYVYDLNLYTKIYYSYVYRLEKSRVLTEFHKFVRIPVLKLQKLLRFKTIWR